MPVFKAYIKTDPLEDEEVVNNLVTRLRQKGVQPILTERDSRDIYDPQPFLYYRNPYVRFEDELNLIHFHHQNPDMPFIRTFDFEMISFSRFGDGHCFALNQRAYSYEPKIEPLPILLGVHQRPEYLKLTLNSLLHSLLSPRQKVYIVASQADPKSLKLISDLLSNPMIEVVVSEKNLVFSFANFGSKFFNLKKFVHFEDDGILPDNVNYYAPYWTNQLNHRSTTADLVGLRISDQNWSPRFLKSHIVYSSQRMQIPEGTVWHYTKPNPSVLTPMGGLGLVVDAEKNYHGFQAPGFCTSDQIMQKDSKILCVANIQVYHLGANQDIDYPGYGDKKRGPTTVAVERFQKGTNLRTGETKQIDLLPDWKDWVDKSPSMDKV